MEEPISVKLEVRRMRETVLQAFTQHQEDIRAHLAEQLERSITNFDYNQVVHQAINEIMPSLIRKEVQSAVYRVLEEADVRSELERAARGAVADYMLKGGL